MKSISLKKIVSFFLVAAMVFALTACAAEPETSPAAATEAPAEAATEAPAEAATEAPAASNEKSYVVIAGAASSGTWFLLANTMSAVLNNTYGSEGWIVSAQTSSGTGENVRLLGSGDVNFAFAQGGTCADAYSGGITWTEAPATYLRTIGYCYPVYIQLVVAKDSGINSVEDLAGKHVSVGVAGSSTEINSNQVCAAAGIDYTTAKDLTPEYVMESDAADMLKNGQIDAAFVPAPIGSATMKDIMSTGNFKLVNISAEIAATLTSDYNAAYYASVIPAGSYDGQDEDITSVSYAIYLMTSETVNQDLVYKFTKAIYENNAALAETYAGIVQMTPEMAAIGAPAPLAEGAERYFKEIGAMK